MKSKEGRPDKGGTDGNNAVATETSQGTTDRRGAAAVGQCPRWDPRAVFLTAGLPDGKNAAEGRRSNPWGTEGARPQGVRLSSFRAASLSRNPSGIILKA